MNESKNDGGPGAESVGGLGYRLRHVRTTRNLSQDEVARIVGASGASVSAYETGTAQPRLDWLVVFSRKMQADLTWLLTGEHPTYEETARSTEEYAEATTTAPAGEPVSRKVFFCPFCDQRIAERQPACHNCHAQLSWPEQ